MHASSISTSSVLNVNTNESDFMEDNNTIGYVFTDKDGLKLLLELL
jgi:hypothetical protein